MNQTCRPLLAKIPKTGWERRKFPVEARAISIKRSGIATENFVEWRRSSFGNFPKPDVNWQIQRHERGSPHLKEFGFVRDLGDGKAAVRWSRIVLFVGILTLGSGVALLGISYIFDVESQWKMVLPQIAAAMICLVIAVEIQKQRIVVGRWSWRFSLAGMLWITLFVAVLLALAINIAQSTQREFAFGKKVVESIKAITQSGETYSQSRGGRFVVVVTRSDFSDEDLAKVIRVATSEGDSNCQIISMVIWGTSVTEQGLAQLESCPQLEVLSTSAGPFSESTRSRLAGLRRLRDITLDKTKFTVDDLEQLRSSIPHARVNGR